MSTKLEEALKAKAEEAREKTFEMIVATAHNIKCVEGALQTAIEENAAKASKLDVLVAKHEAGEDVTSAVAKLYETIKPPKTDHWR